MRRLRFFFLFFSCIFATEVLEGGCSDERIGVWNPTGDCLGPDEKPGRREKEWTFGHMNGRSVAIV